MDRDKRQPKSKNTNVVNAQAIAKVYGNEAQLKSCIVNFGSIPTKHGGILSTRRRHIGHPRHRRHFLRNDITIRGHGRCSPCKRPSRKQSHVPHGTLKIRAQPLVLNHTKTQKSQKEQLPTQNKSKKPNDASEIKHTLTHTYTSQTFSTENDNNQEKNVFT